VGNVVDWDTGTLHVLFLSGSPLDVTVTAEDSYNLWAGLISTAEFFSRVRMTEVAAAGSPAPVESEPAVQQGADFDGDGVADNLDRCPVEYAETPDGCPAPAGPVENEPAVQQGTDFDGDGLPDDRDECPVDYAQTPDGCPGPAQPVASEPVVEQAGPAVPTISLHNGDVREAAAPPSTIVAANAERQAPPGVTVRDSGPGITRGIQAVLLPEAGQFSEIAAQDAAVMGVQFILDQDGGMVRVLLDGTVVLYERAIRDETLSPFSPYLASQSLHRQSST